MQLGCILPCYNTATPRRGGENMRDTAERRIKMLLFLCERRQAKVGELANEFDVSVRTVHYDLDILSCSFPITFKRGINGGACIVDGFCLGMKYLTNPQTMLLEKLSASLAGEDLTLMREILKTFKKPS